MAEWVLSTVAPRTRPFFWIVLAFSSPPSTLNNTSTSGSVTPFLKIFDANNTPPSVRAKNSSLTCSRSSLTVSPWINVHPVSSLIWRPWSTDWNINKVLNPHLWHILTTKTTILSRILLLNIIAFWYAAYVEANTERGSCSKASKNTLYSVNTPRSRSVSSFIR